MSTPPIPARLAHRPTRSGLAVPYISMEIDGQALLGEVRGIRVAECVVNRLCQACGQKILQRPFVFLVTQQMLDDGFSPEPPLHPECAAYSIKACPMVAGRMPTYSRAERDHTGKPCTVEGCDCGGIVTHNEGKRGEPSVPWFSAWIPDYQIAVRSTELPLVVGNVNGCLFTGAPVKVRPVPRPAVEGAVR